MNDQFHRRERVLLDLFKRARMRPSQRFYDRMAHAPWATYPSRVTVPGSRRLLLLAAATGTLVLIVLFLFVVPFRSLAQQAFDFFTRGETDTIASPAFIEPTAVTPVLGDLEDVEQASRVAGFAIHLPENLPTDLQVVAFSVNPGSVSVTYSDGQTTLIFLQQANAAASLYIGANAEVEIVPIDGVTGEYVRGGWRQTETGIVWDNTLPNSHLFWEKDNVRYSLTVETGTVSQETLIQIANSVP